MNLARRFRVCVKTSDVCLGKHFLNAEGAEVFAEVRKVRRFSARLCENLCVLCVKILFEIAHPEF
ncbi:MAG: hypothetical protein QOH71_4320 [Blastocatellia bacterium]|nr:hypothetical protein [Blastocatellia bacterium]